MRAVIAEDSVLLRIGVVQVPEMAGFEVCAEVADADGLLMAVEERRRTRGPCRPAPLRRGR